MNAYELADFVEISKPDDKAHQLIATMLRAQQAEIEELKAKFQREFEYVEKKFSNEWWQGVAEYNKGKEK
jgi:hypothetical protein